MYVKHVQLKFTFVVETARSNSQSTCPPEPRCCPRRRPEIHSLGDNDCAPCAFCADSSHSQRDYSSNRSQCPPTTRSAPTPSSPRCPSNRSARAECPSLSDSDSAHRHSAYIS